MAFVQLICLAVSALLFTTVEAQCTGRTRIVTIPIVNSRPAPTPIPTATAGCTVEDLISIVLLVQALGNNNKEEPTGTSVVKNPPLNVENIILKLLNALVYITTQNANCKGQGTTGGSVKPTPGSYHMGHNGSSGSDSLIEVDLLGGNGNVADVKLSGKTVADVNLGGGGKSGSGYDGGLLKLLNALVMYITTQNANCTGQGTTGGSVKPTPGSYHMGHNGSSGSDSLIEVDLLGGNGNVADVKLSGKTVADVNLGGGGKSGSGYDGDLLSGLLDGSDKAGSGSEGLVPGLLNNLL